MSQMERYITLMICSLLITFNMLAQNYSAVAGKINDDNISSYLGAINNHAVIYTGKEEPMYNVRTTNHPYLNTIEFKKGELSYDGRVYKDVMLRLNCNIDELTVMNPDRTLSIIVPKDRVDYAVIDSMYIIYHKPKPADRMGMSEGYYVRTYNGDCQVWKRETCFLKNVIKDYEVEYLFAKKLKIYIYKDGTYYPVKRKGSVLKLFASKRRELSKIIKQSGLSFSSNPEKVVVEATKYYDKLNK